MTLRTGTPELVAALVSPPAAKIQLPTGMRSSTQVASAASATNHRISTGMPGTLGVPLLKVSTQPVSAIQAKSPGKASPEKKGASQSSSVASRTPRSCVEPPVAALSPTSDKPRRMNRKASVTMKDGRPDLMTMNPLIEPTIAAKAKVSGIARISGRPKLTVAAAKNRPANATIEPIDRSNSPPIIRSAAPMARMPSCAAGVMKLITPDSVNIAGIGGGEEERRHEDHPRDGAQLGPLEQAGDEALGLQPLVGGRCGGRVCRHDPLPRVSV